MYREISPFLVLAAVIVMLATTFGCKQGEIGQLNQIIADADAIKNNGGTQTECADRFGPPDSIGSIDARTVWRYYVPKQSTRPLALLCFHFDSSDRIVQIDVMALDYCDPTPPGE